MCIRDRLTSPIETKGIDCPMPWDEIEKLTHYAPNLGSTCNEVEWGNKLGPVNGLRYSYTRLIQHAHLLDAIDVIMEAVSIEPSSIVEIGSFTGGVLHFLAHRDSTLQTVGFDLSPVALDVASLLSERLGIKSNTTWLEADFSLVRSECISESIKPKFFRPIILLTNVIHAIGKQLSFSPAVEQFHAEAGLISYWVNQGALVIVSDRTDSPVKQLVQSWVDNGRWNGDGCEASILSEFECWSTREMSPDHPLGQWYYPKSFVAAFFNETWGVKA